MTSTRWLDLDGAVNVRDLGGLPTADGRRVQPHRLIRSDNLQGLSESDVRYLVDELGVRSVVDLRTGVEVRSEGPGPIFGEPVVEVRHLSLFPETGETTDAAADQHVVLPWADRDDPDSEDERRRGTSGVYLTYIDERPDSIIGALRTIAGGTGATVVHCAAGKDRTGVVIAFALTEVGVTREAIVEDYELTADRITQILARLRASATYENDIVTQTDDDKHRPRAVTMQRLLDAVDEQHGGVARWLRDNGWTEDDAAALRAKLLD